MFGYILQIGVLEYKFHWYVKNALGVIQSKWMSIAKDVVIFLPTSSNKFISTWKGPYKVTQKLENDNYEVEIC